jgi:hypothetical protein
MKKLLITGCNDRNMWYSGLVGKEVPFLREEHDAFMSREPAGFVNFVRKADGRLVEDDVQPVGLLKWSEVQKAISTKDVTNFLGHPVVADPTMPPHQMRLVNRSGYPAVMVYGSAQEWAESRRELGPQDAAPLEWIHPDRAAAMTLLEEDLRRRLGFLDKGTNGQ